MFFNILEKLCIDNGMTVTELVLKLGLSSSNATSWKKGSAPRVKTLKKIADYFNIPAEYLIDNTPIKTTSQPPSSALIHTFESNSELDADEEKLLKVFRLLSNKNKSLALARIYELEEEQK